MSSFLARYRLAVASYEFAYSQFAGSVAMVAACRAARIDVIALENARVKFVSELRALGFSQACCAWHLLRPGQSYERGDGSCP